MATCCHREHRRPDAMLVVLWYVATNIILSLHSSCSLGATEAESMALTELKCGYEIGQLAPQAQGLH